MTKFGRFFCNALWVTASALFQRAVQVAFSCFLSGRVGADGLGRFSLILTVYGFAVTLACSGFHLAVTRVVSEEAGCGHSETVGEAVRFGVRLAAGCGFGAALLLFLSAPVIARRALGDASAALSLRILACSLVPLSLTNVFSGTLAALRQAAPGAAVTVSALLFRIFVTVLCLFRGRFSALSPSVSLAFGMTCAEFAGCALLLPFFLRGIRPFFHLPVLKDAAGTDRCRGAAEDAAPAASVRFAVLRIALPIGISACIRSALIALEHFLIPLGLRKSGLGAEAALALYGTIHGIALPAVLFPAAFLSAGAALVIPEIASHRAEKRFRSISRNAFRALYAALLFSVFVSGVFLCFSEEIGALLSDGAETARCIRMLAALIPVMYLDTMTDAVLKGMDAQLDSMRYNLLDAAFSVCFAAWILPRLGMYGYVLLLYLSELFNFSMSFGKLLSLVDLRISPVRFVFRPVLCIGAAAVCAVFCARIAAFCGVTFRFLWVSVFFHTALTAVFDGAFLMLTGALTGDAVRELCFMLGLGRKSRR